MPSATRLPACLLLALLACACIERPETARTQGSQIDRAAVSDVLLAQEPNPLVRVGAVFDGIELVGYDVAPDPVPPGQRGTITFYFRARQDVGENWRVFVHLDDEEKRAPRINADHVPAGGRFPTGAWRKGDIVKDSFSFVAPASGVERLEVWTGLYQGEERLPLTSAGRGISDGTNRVRAGSIVIR